MQSHSDLQVQIQISVTHIRVILCQQQDSLSLRLVAQAGVPSNKRAPPPPLVSLGALSQLWGAAGTMTAAFAAARVAWWRLAARRQSLARANGAGSGPGGHARCKPANGLQSGWPRRERLAGRGGQRRGGHNLNGAASPLGDVSVPPSQSLQPVAPSRTPGLVCRERTLAGPGEAGAY